MFDWGVGFGVGGGLYEFTVIIFIVEEDGGSIVGGRESKVEILDPVGAVDTKWDIKSFSVCARGGGGGVGVGNLAGCGGFLLLLLLIGGFLTLFGVLLLWLLCLLGLLGLLRLFGGFRGEFVDGSR